MNALRRRYGHARSGPTSRFRIVETPRGFVLRGWTPDDVRPLRLFVASRKNAASIAKAYQQYEQGTISKEALKKKVGQALSPNWGVP